MESGIHGLTEVELLWAECRNLMALIKKKVVDAVMALVVSNMITTSTFLEQVQVKAYKDTLDPALILQVPQGGKGGDPSMEV